MTTPTYASLGYNSGQNYKLFKVFEQQRMKYDDNHLASDDYLKSLLTAVSQGAVTPRTQDIKHRAHHSGTVRFLSMYTPKHRANH